MANVMKEKEQNKLIKKENNTRKKALFKNSPSPHPPQKRMQIQQKKWFYSLFYTLKTNELFIFFLKQGREIELI